MKSILMIIIVVLLILLLIISLTQKKRRHDLDEWSIAHSSLGYFFIFILMAGEITTTFALLGSPGFIYGMGGSAFYTLAMTTILGAELYFLQPMIWRRNQALHALSQTEYYTRALQSPALGKIVTIISTIALIPYIAIQISGLAIITNALTYGAVSLDMARLWGIIGIIAYAIIGGIRGAANLALVKDTLLLIIVLIVGLYLPLHLFGSWPHILQEIEYRFPTFTILHTAGYGYTWFITTSAITCIGYSFWPHLFSSIFAASGPTVLKKSQIISPIYSLFLFPLTIVGFTAKLNNPHIPLSQRDNALLNLTMQHLPSETMIILALGGILTALIPSTVMTISLAMNIVKTFSNPQITGEQNHSSVESVESDKIFPRIFSSLKDPQNIIVKSIVIIIVISAAGFSAFGNESIQGLLVAGYGIISQLAIPCYIDFWQMKHPEHARIPVAAIITGLISGVSFATAAGLCRIDYTWLKQYLPDSLAQLNTGIVALLINIFMVYGVTQFFRRKNLARKHYYRDKDKKLLFSDQKN